MDDEHSRQVFDGIKAANHRTVIGISYQGPVEGGIYVEGGVLINDVKGLAERIMDLSSRKNLPGSHNAQNIAAAYAVACAMHIPTEQIVQGIESFPGLAHRQERLGEFGGVTFVNDSKATNAEATAKALACYDNIHWILGGRAKEGGLDGLDKFYGNVRKAYLIGECANDFAGQLKGKVETMICGDLDTATKAAFEDASGGQATVLLSPAAASFDQFRNFEIRGDAFRDAVDRVTKDATRGAA